jgi:diamine N-acetyltransferase
MDKIEIEKVTLADIDILIEISRMTFFETFAHLNTAEDMRKYLDESFNEAQLFTELKNKDSEFYFAKRDHTVVGYLKLNSGLAQTDLHDPKALEIERIYVLKDYLGMRVGQVLFDKALEIASQANMEYVWLGVWENN